MPYDSKHYWLVFIVGLYGPFYSSDKTSHWHKASRPSLFSPNVILFDLFIWQNIQLYQIHSCQFFFFLLMFLYKPNIPHEIFHFSLVFGTNAPDTVQSCVFSHRHTHYNSEGNTIVLWQLDACIFFIDLSRISSCFILISGVSIKLWSPSAMHLCESCNRLTALYYGLIEARPLDSWLKPHCASEVR